MEPSTTKPEDRAKMVAGVRTLSLFYIGGALLLLALSIPLLLGMVPPNGLYGFRVEKTMSDATIWYAANKVLGADLLIASLVLLGTSVFLFTRRHVLTVLRVAMVGLAVTVLAVGAAIAHTAMAIGHM